MSVVSATSIKMLLLPGLLCPVKLLLRAYCKPFLPLMILLFKLGDYVPRATEQQQISTISLNLDTVCLRPSMPAVGGENIWPTFRTLYYSNATDKESDEMRYRTKLLYIASSTTGILLVAVISLSLTLACTLQPCQQSETPYQHFPARLPDSPPNPYGQTTTQPLIEPGTPATTYNEP